MGVSLYEIRDKKGEQGYSTWVDAQPNLHTFLTAINQSNPIIGCQFELVWSRWPRTIFFAKNITIPGVSVNTLDLNHAGFTIKIPTHVTYDNTEVSINIIADKEGFHYYDLRNMVMQTGHPLVAGDPRATIGNQFGLRTDEDILEVRLRNRPSDDTHHHWVLHNFHPTGIGDIELSTDGGSFVEFELKGTITHITYDCGKAQQEAPSSLESDSEQPEGEADQPDTNDEDTDNDEFEGEPPFDDPTEEDEEDEEDDDWDDQDEWSDEEWEKREEIDETEKSEKEDEDEATLDDEDERSAYEILKENGDKSDKELMFELKKKFSKENPDEDPELIETRAEYALDAAKKYKAKHQDDAAEQQFRKASRASENKPRIVLCKNKCGWIGTKFGEANETLTRAVRFNHRISDIKYKLFLDNVDEELEAYSCKTAKLTLPARFKMLKTPKTTQKVTQVELEEPDIQLDSTSQSNTDPNHKRRDIFG